MSSHRSWVSPEGKIHALRGLHTHVSWAIENSGKHGLPSDTCDNPRAPFDAGWIRKMDPQRYHIGLEHHLPKVIAHVKKHHPDVKQVRVWYDTGKKGEHPFDPASRGVKGVQIESRADALIKACLNESTMTDGIVKRFKLDPESTQPLEPHEGKPPHPPHQIGYSPTKKLWYGWSHRAVHGFKSKEQAKRFARSVS